MGEYEYRVHVGFNPNQITLAFTTTTNQTSYKLTSLLFKAYAPRHRLGGSHMMSTSRSFVLCVSAQVRANMTPAETNMPGSATQVVFDLLHPFLTTCI